MEIEDVVTARAGSPASKKGGGELNWAEFMGQEEDLGEMGGGAKVSV